MTDTITINKSTVARILSTIQARIDMYDAKLTFRQIEEMFRNERWAKTELEAALAAPEPQPVKQADQSCRNCTFHYKDVDMPPCSSCTLGDHVGNNWEPMSAGQKKLANRGGDK